MKKISMKKMLSAIGCVVLIAAAALGITGCSSESYSPAETGTPVTFTLLVVDAQGAETQFEITSSQEMVGQALIDEGLLEGEDGPYGLYVKTVNGITADYDVDGTYWGFYINGEYAMTGVDMTPIEAGQTYTLRIESDSTAG